MERPMYASESTDTLLDALMQASTLDLDTLKGSGLDVCLYRMGKAEPYMARVTLHPEDLGPFQKALVHALDCAVIRRKDHLRRQIEAIDSVRKTVPPLA